MVLGEIGIVGDGYVGQAYDKAFNASCIKGEHGTYDDINSCSLVVVCVPTPQKKDGSCDTSIVEQVVKEIEAPLILIKSTIPPGTTERLKKKTGKRIVFSPEYIGEGGYRIPKGYPDPNDPTTHDFQIFGGDPADTKEVLQYAKKVWGPFCKYMQTDATTAELIKYMENSWIAAKVTFVNEFKRVADAFEVDFNVVREGWLLDSRVGPSHSVVFDDKPYFDGKCIPKDLSAIIRASEEAGFTSILLNAINTVNKKTIGEYK